MQVEPVLAQLYRVVVDALVEHTERVESGICGACARPSPCATLRRACFLIEVF